MALKPGEKNLGSRRYAARMRMRNRAQELANSGRYVDADEVIWALFKEGYSDARGDLGFIERWRLARLCRTARKERARLNPPA